ncbi:MAG: hypothetical protein HRU28_06365 [Rhizobiales bacterium]|nr:hypothetical protein [Hyphomicrobiales bacterium]
MYIPSANILWTGNVIVAQAPALPWLLDGHLIETRDTLQVVLDKIDDKTIVVPRHGPITDKQAIKWNIDYLNQIEVEIKKAIGNGLSLDETIAKIKLDDFRGYALFDWVHLF